jgi:hypothetical protein
MATSPWSPHKRAFLNRDAWSKGPAASPMMKLCWIVAEGLLAPLRADLDPHYLLRPRLGWVQACDPDPRRHRRCWKRSDYCADFVLFHPSSLTRRYLCEPGALDRRIRASLFCILGGELAALKGPDTIRDPTITCRARLVTLKGSVSSSLCNRANEYCQIP